MKDRLFIWTLLVEGGLHVPLLMGQGFHIQTGYSYLWCRSWDRVLNYYYFTRPYLNGSPRYLESGFTVSTGYAFSSFRAPIHGVVAGYSNAWAVYREDNYRLRFWWHTVMAGYRARLRRMSRAEGFYGELGIHFAGAWLERKSYWKDNNTLHHRYVAFGWGGGFSGEAGYMLPYEEWVARPGFFVKVASNFIHMPGAEVALNQTQGLYLRNWHTVVMLQGGISLLIR
ncbi:MAG: hypothetical protein NZM65_04240 [Flavobacteriales bacterium]|nr:hypothetical protein [Flavobacteriales bacterium]MDW8409879.1 hypothetical protein [Flavobacteriales bacterium]